MNTPRYAVAAAKLLSKHLPRVTPALVERERSIATIERAIRARTRRRRWLAVGGSLAVAAALVLAVQIGKRRGNTEQRPLAVQIEVSPSGAGAALQAGDGVRPLAASAALQAGQRIETSIDGGAALRFSTGTSLTLAGSSAFRVDSQGAVEHFSLQRGDLSAHVAKLGAGQRFIVETPDAEVEVRGTRFQLNVLSQAEACGAGSRTRLRVTEGIVEVRAAGKAIAVKAGESWPADCNADRAPAAAVEREPSLPAQEPRSPSKRTAARSTSAPAPAGEAERPLDRASALAAPNDLFAEGVAKRRQGDVSGALRAYQELLSRFPRSALAENALAARMRLLASVGDAARVSEAKRYLARYPNGFAVNEAREIAAEP